VGLAAPGGKGAKGTKSPKGSSKKGTKSSKGATAAPTALPSAASCELPECVPCGFDISDCANRRRLDMGDRRLHLQYMTDRFNEDGSISSFVDSLGYEVDLNPVTGEKENVLAKKDCEGLMSLIDHGSHSNVDEPSNIDKYIDESDLVSVIGKVSVAS
jgi:hypothetical protein